MTDRGRALVAAGLVAVLAGTSGCTGHRPGGPRPTDEPSASAAGNQVGAAGAGDPYFPMAGNGGYDVDNYLVKIRYDPATDKLTGDVTVTATASAGLIGFNLDLVGLTVRSVQVDGVAATHRREAGELIVTPATPLLSGTRFAVRIGYDGSPAPPARAGTGIGGFLHTADGAFAIGEPVSAATWYPVNDHPSDKATYTIEITAPDSLAALSNGTPGPVTRAAGWATSTWQVVQPMASYLSTVVIGKYRVAVGSHGGKPMITAVAASLPHGMAEEVLARTGEIADLLAGWFGPYPFESYGGVVLDDPRIGYALETQTRPLYGSRFFRQPEASWVVAHELAHQWYGDSVSVRNWRDIWLNEGFATYGEWLWAAHDGGRSVQEQVDKEYAEATPEVWLTPPANPGVTGLFGRSVYRRGAMALHALRRTIGDETFFRILKAWTAGKRNANATTAEFVSVAERESGRRLRPLFDAWLYGRQRPSKP